MWSVLNSFRILFLILLPKDFIASRNGVADLLLASVVNCTCGTASHCVNLQRQRIGSSFVLRHRSGVLMLKIEEEQSTAATLSHLEGSASASPILFFPCNLSLCPLGR